MYLTGLYCGSMIQSRSAARRAAQDLVMNKMMIDDLGNLDYDDFGHVYSGVVYQPSSLFVNSINNV